MNESACDKGRSLDGVLVVLDSLDLENEMTAYRYVRRMLWKLSRPRLNTFLQEKQIPATKLEKTKA